MALTFQQLRCLCQVVDSDFSVSRAALRLHTTQPGVSKMIRALEAEAGSELFARTGNRLVGVTEAGELALTMARRMLNDAAAIARLGPSFQESMTGDLRLGTTHFHARYPLLPILAKFTQVHSGVRLELLQGNPVQIARWLEEGSIDLGVGTVPDRLPDGVAALHAYRVERCIIVSAKHPLLTLRKVSFSELAKYPFIAYDNHFASGKVLEREFEKHGLVPRIVMRVTDASVAKAYVALGMGVALLQRPAVDKTADADVAVLGNAPKFPPSQTAIMLSKGQVLRPYVKNLISMINPTLGDVVNSRIIAA